MLLLRLEKDTDSREGASQDGFRASHSTVKDINEMQSSVDYNQFSLTVYSVKPVRSGQRKDYLKYFVLPFFPKKRF